jgi:hypothetical protein
MLTGVAEVRNDPGVAAGAATNTEVAARAEAADTATAGAGANPAWSQPAGVATTNVAGVHGDCSVSPATEFAGMRWWDMVVSSYITQRV